MTTPQYENRPLKDLLQTIALLLTPDGLYFLTLLVLFAIFGGHHHAYIQRNPYCQIPVHDDPSRPRSLLSNTSLPPHVVIHISDLHVNDIEVGHAKHHLQIFKDHILPKWGPLSHAVIASGDLVHSVKRSGYPLGSYSMQQESEWTYLDSYAKQINQTTAWISTHGNHDSFGGKPHHHPHVPRLSSLASCSAETSNANNSARVKPYQFANGTLVIIAVDATLPQPLHRPLNFFGDFRDASTQLKTTLTQLESAQDAISRDILVFAHYPSSVMRGGKHLHAIALRKSQEPPKKSQHEQVPHWQKPRFAAFLSGHLHSLYDTVPHGLQAVSTSGALELETIDLVASGGYRVLAFDSGYLSFRTFSLKPSNNEQDSPFDDFVILNPPRAGLCSAGAGHAALTSTHVRILSPMTDFQRKEAIVRIDGQILGRMEKFDSECDKGAQGPEQTTCKHVYGVVWNPALYASGIHNLTLHIGEMQSDVHTFSLEGTFDTSWKARLRSLESILFSLSNFEVMSPILANVAFCLTMLFCIPGILIRKLPSYVFMLYALFLAFGAPFLIGKGLTAVDKGYGWVGIKYTFLSSKLTTSGVDAPFALSRFTWGVLVRASFTQMVVQRYLRRSRFSYLLLISLIFYLKDSFFFCLDIAGAYGIDAALLSPCCVPLLVISLWSSIGTGKSILKRITFD